MDGDFGGNVTLQGTVSPETTSEPSGYELKDPVQRIIIAILTSLVSVIGVPGNTLVIVAVAMSKKLQTQTNAFVVNLAVTDLSSCLILPFMTVALLNDVWPLPDSLCTFVGGLILIGLWGSVINLAFIAFNRYYLITRPRFVYNKLYSRRNLAVMLSMTWIISSAVIVVPVWFGIGGIGFNERYKVCSTISTNEYSDLYAMLTAGLVQIPSLIVIVTCYIKIYRFISLKSRELFKSKATKLENSDGKGGDQSSAQAASFRRQVQVTKNLFIVVCSYIFCIMPFSISSLIPPSYPVMPWVSVLLILNSCVNPIIYGLKHPQFQVAFRQIATCRWSVVKDQTNTSQGISTKSSSVV